MQKRKWYGRELPQKVIHAAIPEILIPENKIPAQAGICFSTMQEA
jgi:hypothetical protein